MQKLAYLPATLITLSMAAPALAETMVTSQGAAPEAAAGDRSIASGDDAFRPTNYLGLDRAQVLADDSVVGSLSSFSVAKGFGNGLEVGGGVGLSLTSAPTFGLPVNAYGKMVLAHMGSMAVALGARANLGYTTPTAAGVSPVAASAGVFLPISFWALGPGDLTLMPMAQFGSAGVTGGASVGYELPITSKWTLEVADSFVGGAGNSLSVGSRVALTPNLTADLGSVSLSGSTVTVNLLTIGGSFGGKMADVHKAWGM